MDCHVNGTTGFFQFLYQGGNCNLAAEARLVVGMLLGAGILLLLILVWCSILNSYCCYFYYKHKMLQKNHKG